MTAWTDLVSKFFKENKHKEGYKLKDAMVDAKKVYKKPAEGSKPVDGSKSVKSKTKKVKKSRKSRKGKKMGKSRKNVKKDD